MLDPKFFDNIAKQLSLLVPTQLQHLRDELENNFKAALQTTFSKLDLVTREDFDVQVRLLQRANERIALLEKEFKQMEETKSK